MEKNKNSFRKPGFMSTHLVFTPPLLHPNVRCCHACQFLSKWVDYEGSYWSQTESPKEPVCPTITTNLCTIWKQNLQNLPLGLNHQNIPIYGANHRQMSVHAGWVSDLLFTCLYFYWLTSSPKPHVSGFSKSFCVLLLTFNSASKTSKKTFLCLCTNILTKNEQFAALLDYILPCYLLGCQSFFLPIVSHVFSSYCDWDLLTYSAPSLSWCTSIITLPRPHTCWVTVILHGWLRSWEGRVAERLLVLGPSDHVDTFFSGIAMAC